MDGETISIAAEAVSALLDTTAWPALGRVSIERAVAPSDASYAMLREACERRGIVCRRSA